MKKFISLFVALCVALIPLIVSSPAQAASKSLTTTANLHMRTKPGSHGKSVAILKKGTKVKSQRTSKGWYYVSYKGKKGWMSGKYLSSKKKSSKPVKSKKRTVKKKANKPKGKKAIIRATANKHGCSSTRIVYNNRKILGGHAGRADWYTNTIHLNSSKSLGFLKYAVAHECAHMKQYVKYKGNIKKLSRDMNRVYGGRGYTGLERNADCVTRHWGYKTSVYTNKCGGKRGKVARSIASVRVKY